MKDLNVAMWISYKGLLLHFRASIFLSPYIYIHIYTYVHAHTDRWIDINICVHTRKQAYIYIYIFIYIYSFPVLGVVTTTLVYKAS